MSDDESWMGISRRRRRFVKTQAQPDQMQVVPRVPVRCPFCGATRGIKNNSGPTGSRVQYHECAGCAKRFKSIEVIP